MRVKNNNDLCCVFGSAIRTIGMAIMKKKKNPVASIPQNTDPNRTVTLSAA
jgi:hypothetical protein